jgi:1,4-alpha-glucan branching enzyme
MEDTGDLICFLLIRLSANATRSWLVDINNETLKPASWDELADEKPKLDSFSDITIYELHIRDFRSICLRHSECFISLFVNKNLERCFL